MTSDNNHREICDVFKKVLEPVNIHFDSLTCTVKSRKLLKLRKIEKKAILKNIHGDFLSGKLTGIIGPSGCGKSTLLDIISGYKLKGVTGYVYVNGRERNIQKLIKQSCYIMQDDQLEPFVTVEEAMTFVANVKLSTKISEEDKIETVSVILQNFGLSEHRRTLTTNLSGGQRKRLAIAVELISNPPVLFLDEPTSGLDSKSAKQCIHILRNLSSEGRTVVCSIHQPSMSILDMFDNVYMLSEGQCIYQGTIGNIIPYLQANELECPIYHNPVEYVMELCVFNSNEDIKKLVQASHNGKSQEWLDTPTCWSTIPLNTLNVKEMECHDVNENYQYATPFSHQFSCLLHRKLLISTRDPLLWKIRIVAHVVVGLFLGLMFYNIGNDASKVFVNLNLIFFNIMFTMFNALTSRIISFPQNLVITRREYFNRWYSAKAHFLSSIFADIPVQIFSVTVFCLPLYYLTDQPLEWHRFLRVLLISNLVPLVFQDYGILVGTLMNVQNGLIFGMFTTTPYVMFSGFFLYYRDTPKVFQWMYETSVVRHAIEAVSIAIFGYGRKPLYCDVNKYLLCPFKYPQDFLKQVDITTNRFTTNLLFIIIFGILVKILCYIALKYKLSRGQWRPRIFQLPVCLSRC